jgi:hypothetical protein
MQHQAGLLLLRFCRSKRIDGRVTASQIAAASLASFLLLLAETPFGPNAEAISNDEHPDHQLGINRWATYRAVERRELAAQFRQLDKAVNRPQ